MDPSRDCAEQALRFLAGLRVQPGSGSEEFARTYLSQWVNATPDEINHTVGLLRDMLRARAVTCILDLIQTCQKQTPQTDRDSSQFTPPAANAS